MILEYKNDEGYIYAYITWNIITPGGKLENNAEVVSIGGAWVHPRFRHLGILAKMISDLFYHSTTQKSLYVLTSRDKYPDRPNRLVPIMKYFKYIKGAKDVKRETGNTTNNYSNTNC